MQICDGPAWSVSLVCMADRWTPGAIDAVFEAASWARWGAVADVIAGGFPLNAKGRRQQYTILHFAAGTSFGTCGACVSHAPTARLALAAGADPNATSVVGLTPLCCAAMYGTVEVVLELLAAGVDVNAGTASGGCPLVILSRRRRDGLEVDRILAELLPVPQLDLQAMDRHMTAEQWAIDCGQDARAGKMRYEVRVHDAM